MNIIVRCCGERTEQKCIDLAKKHGTVHVVRARPFGESIRKSYKLALSFKGQKWVPMIDGDVLLIDGNIEKAIKYLNELNDNKIFCLDGKTKDKIMRCTRRAGIHIYRRALLNTAYKYIDNKQLKPESFVRRTMTKNGYKTVTGKIVFGYHDYEQYYCDLWRKSFCQSQKLARKIKKSNIKKKWKLMANKDNDYKVILAAHIAARRFRGKIIIDKNIDFGARDGIKKLNLTEKEGL
jgi:hypothetical protein